MRFQFAAGPLAPLGDALQEFDRALPAIAAELGVDALIEGRVRRQGDQVRITVQLIKGEADEHVWHESYDEELRDILALQARIASK